MSPTPKLLPYREKRNFKVTPEPSGGRKKTSHQPIFVVQKHAARALHYDLRLESEGVLKSWAVPKGPSLDPDAKHLAVPTEDHPLDYADFEGVIPKGEYGAGAVIVWDTGPYRNISDKEGSPLTMAQAEKKGHIKVWLEGKKLKGAFSLFRFRQAEGHEKESWLLVKMKDEHADAKKDIIAQDASVLSGRKIEDLQT
jgi:DNA ligase D-like protein (predicted 3'-phosphoesterase)